MNNATNLRRLIPDIMAYRVVTVDSVTSLHPVYSVNRARSGLVTNPDYAFSFHRRRPLSLRSVRTVLTTPLISPGNDRYPSGGRDGGGGQ